MLDTDNKPQTKVLIVEDEVLTGERLRTILIQCGYHVTAVARDYEEAMAAVKKEAPHVAICDIAIGYPDGITVADDINKIVSEKVPIIYLTANSHNQQKRAYQSYPVSYLIKSFDVINRADSLDSAIQMAIFQKEEDKKFTIPQNKDFLDIRVDGAMQRIKIKDILFMNADDMKTHIVCNQELITVNSPLGRVLDELEHPDIIRVQRSFAINKTKVVEYDTKLTYVSLDRSEMKVKFKTEGIKVGREFRDRVKIELNIGQ